MTEFEYRTPVIPQLNFKNISSKRFQILESESLSCHDLNDPHRSTQEYKPVLPQANHGYGYPKNLDVLYQFSPEQWWYYQTGAKLPNLPSASFTSSDFLNFVMTPYVVRVYFLFSDLKFNYTGKAKYNFKIPHEIILELCCEWL